MNKLNKTLAISLATLTLAGSSSPIFAGKTMGRKTICQDSRKMSIENSQKPRKSEKPQRIQQPIRSNTLMLELADYQPVLEREKKGICEELQTIMNLRSRRLNDMLITEEIYKSACALLEYQLTTDETLIKTANDVIENYEINQNKIQDFKDLLKKMPSPKLEKEEYYEMACDNVGLIRYILDLTDAEEELKDKAAKILYFIQTYYNNRQKVEYKNIVDEDED